MTPRKQETRWDREKKEKKQNTSGFTQKKLNSNEAQRDEEKQVPAWIIVVFLFALVFTRFLSTVEDIILLRQQLRVSIS